MPAIAFRNRTLSRRLLGALFLFCIASAELALAKSSIYIVVIAVANMYSHPTDQSDVVSQAIYGSNVLLLTARGEWCRVQTADQYRGWIPSRQLRLVQSETGYATARPGVVRVDSLFANLYREPDVTRHKPVVTVPFETRLEIVPAESEDAGENANVAGKGPAFKPTRNSKPNPEGWLQVRLPDKRDAWIQASDVIADPKPLSIPESIELAKRFLGIPYLWGGTSSFGFDCSGFTQMLLRVRGIVMPRDADKQAAWSGLMAIERGELQAGDLLFFGGGKHDITHTGMYIGDGQFIHDTTHGHPVVQISRLDDEPWTHLLVASRRAK